MDSLSKYFSLMQERPELFRNTGEPGEIRIIDNKERILSEQERMRAQLEKEGKPACWIDIGILAEDEWEYVVRDLVEFPDGRIGGWRRNINRKKVEGGTGVVVMPVQGSKVVLLKHFRHEDRDWHWEFPRGWGTPGLSAEENAGKELAEEIGLLPSKLVQVWRDPATAFFYAELQEGEPQNQDGEAIQRIDLLDIVDLDNWIMSGKITDWFTILTFLMAKNKGCVSS